MSHSLLKFQLGPVQDFIASARSTRDLWSGSYLLSWLVAAGVRKLVAAGGTLIFPNPHEQPLLDLENERSSNDHISLLTPNLPNIFIARVSGDAKRVAGEVKRAIEAEWQEIAKAVWEKREKFGLRESAKARYDAQVARHLSLAWQVTPLGNDYAQAYRLNGWQLDAVRQTRDFLAWDSATGSGEKDSLTGKEEALVGGTDDQKAREKTGGEYNSLFAKHADYLGAVSVIKRCWHLAYLRDKHGLKTNTRGFPIRSIPAIAARKKTLDDDESGGDTGGGDKYIAAIAFDGDSIGAWIGGGSLPLGSDLQQHHQNFSNALSHFALRKIRPIVEALINCPDGSTTVLGQLIYAGGDDVVALVPADAALSTARELREAFRSATKSVADKEGNTPDASVGIAIGHIRAPLQDLIREAKKAEKRAKNAVGRPAFSVTLMKRSGGISYWGSKWDSGGLELYEHIADLLGKDHLSGRFPYRVCELLERYLTARTGLDCQEEALTDFEETADLITREIAFVAERQGAHPRVASEMSPLLRRYLEGIKRSRGEGQDPQVTTNAQEFLTSLINLCCTLAFAKRIQST